MEKLHISATVDEPIVNTIKKIAEKEGKLFETVINELLNKALNEI